MKIFSLCHLTYNHQLVNFRKSKICINIPQMQKPWTLVYEIEYIRKFIFILPLGILRFYETAQQDLIQKL